MKRHRTIAATLTLLASTMLAGPAVADASGPLLSGYGPPGAGTQTILGASLINGPGGGGSGGGGATATSARTASSATSAAGIESLSASSQRPASGNQERSADAHARRGSAAAGVVASSTQQRAAGANPNPSHLRDSSAVVDGSESTSWFSGTDLLALVLASGVLALVALATIRLTRTEHD
ncbi:MAG TPA: hypothetical protein VGL37_08435 [Solirubrobacteraceae bacterium]|jgi:hypothetical protein